jgi:hypothetical protein
VHLLVREEPGGEKLVEGRRTYRVERAEREDAPKRAAVKAVEAIRPAGVRADQGHDVGTAADQDGRDGRKGLVAKVRASSSRSALSATAACYSGPKTRLPKVLAASACIPGRTC